MQLARRTVLATLALALLAPPLAAEAQPSGRVPRVGYLGFERLAPIEGFEQGLKDLGWENGRISPSSLRLGMPTQSSAGSRPWRRHQAEQRSDDDARPVRT
jgi:hypothetical protein